MCLMNFVSGIFFHIWPLATRWYGHLRINCEELAPRANCDNHPTGVCAAPSSPARCSLRELLRCAPDARCSLCAALHYCPLPSTRAGCPTSPVLPVQLTTRVDFPVVTLRADLCAMARSSR